MHNPLPEGGFALRERSKKGFFKESRLSTLKYRSQIGRLPWVSAHKQGRLITIRFLKSHGGSDTMSEVLTNLIQSISEFDRLEIIREAGLVDDRPSILRTGSGSPKEGEEWANQHGRLILPFLLRRVDPADDDVMELVQQGMLSSGNVSLAARGFHVKFSHPGAFDTRMTVSEVAADALVLNELLTSILAVNRAFALPLEMPSVKNVSEGSSDFSLFGQGLLGSGLTLVLACSAGIVSAPLALPIGAAAASMGLVSLVLDWRKAVAEKRKADAETRKTEAEIRKTEAETRKAVAEARKLELEIESDGQVGLRSPYPASYAVPMEIIRREAEAANMSPEYAIILLNRTLPVAVAIKQTMTGANLEVS
jgi:hypothetical protein